ncbi:ABC transporter permease subunit [Actinomadura sp. HBU206391]|uniref:ABC transporter permease subunit n=1 Tax=Actinomadura sp. HBU206391 TaxID=2731692 RepID=UPI001650C48F|nr:ABC transporter permease subunit [Actinomadura sp. HBU206391]MBC6457916.1 ABC transporter permease subunit [Actinomadura sp. HBU206391]
MIWLTWRQFRAAAAMMFAALAALAAVLALTGPGLSDDYASGIAACTTESGGCSNYVQRFFHDNQASFLAVTAIVLLLPALIGLFWGAPLITRELEAGTHRLVWNQSITRTRWLTVKLALTGLAAMTAAGLGSLAVTWWAGPIDKAAAGNSPGFPRLGPLVFDARGIVPIGYAAFAFALGVTIGMLVRRTLPAMAITLVVFVAVQIAMPLLARPHLLPPTRSAIQLTDSKIDLIGIRHPGGPLNLSLEKQVPSDTGAWVLSSRIVDASGKTVAGGIIPVSTSSGPCAPRPAGQEPEPRPGQSGHPMLPCLVELGRLGYRQQLTYHASSRFWTFQWYETAIYTALSLGLSGFCFWWLRRRLS